MSVQYTISTDWGFTDRGTIYRGGKQAAIVVQNIQHLVNNETLEEYDSSDPAAIHLTLGIVSHLHDEHNLDKVISGNTNCLQAKSVVFGNPAVGSTQPMIKNKDDG